MSSKFSGNRKKFMLSAALVLIGMSIAPIASAAIRECISVNGGKEYCQTCYYVFGRYICVPDSLNVLR